MVSLKCECGRAPFAVRGGPACSGNRAAGERITQCAPPAEVPVACGQREADEPPDGWSEGQQPPSATSRGSRLLPPGRHGASCHPASSDGQGREHNSRVLRKRPCSCNFCDRRRYNCPVSLLVQKSISHFGPVCGFRHSRGPRSPHAMHVHGRSRAPCAAGHLLPNTCSEHQ